MPSILSVVACAISETLRPDDPEFRCSPVCCSWVVLYCQATFAPRMDKAEMERCVINYSKKICLLGEFAVGKTSLVRRFVYNIFEDRYLSTIGVRVSRKTVVVPADAQVVELTMMVWDLAGSEEFNRVSMSYLRGAAGAVLVYDLTRPVTFEVLYDYVLNLYKANPSARVVIAANKADLVEPSRLDLTKAETLAEEVKATLFLTSAKVGADVDEMFRYLGKLLIQ